MTEPAYSWDSRPSQSRRPRVLLLAEMCNPELASVPLVGWSHYRALAKVVDGHLVTQIRNRGAVTRAGLVEGRDFTAIDSERVTRAVRGVAERLRGGQGKGWTAITASVALYYYYFEHLVWKQFGGAIKSGEFDIVHRLTPLSPTVPSTIAGKCRRAGVPFVVGPLNGGVRWPKEFRSARHQEREWLSYLRAAYKLLPGYRSTRRNAATILVGSRATLEQVPARYASKCVYMPENAVDPDRFPTRRTRTAGRPLRAIFVGRLVPYKGADMLVEAVGPLARDGAISLDIVGDGPERGRLEDIIRAQGIEKAVRLFGWLPHDQIGARMIDADVLTFPSIREFGGGVVLEAMAVGLVPIVVNYGGPGELVTPESGYLVELGSREEVVARLRQVIEAICQNPTDLDRKSEVALRRVSDEFTWDAKASRVLEIYRSLSRNAHGAKYAGETKLHDVSGHPTTACGAEER